MASIISHNPNATKFLTNLSGHNLTIFGKPRFLPSDKLFKFVPANV